MVSNVNTGAVYRRGQEASVESSWPSSSLSSPVHRGSDSTDPIQQWQRLRYLIENLPAFVFRSIRLLFFVFILTPAFVVFVWYYFTCDRVVVYYGHANNKSEDCGKSQTNDTAGGTHAVKKPNNLNQNYNECESITYNHRENKHLASENPLFSRQYLDIYGSRTATRSLSLVGANGAAVLNHDTKKCNRSSSINKSKKPVVIFLTGGAWTIGYKMWGTLLARALIPFDILVIVPDYRNFPSVDIQGMIDDVDTSIQWVMSHIEEFGGDREKVILVGQSAGAHLGGVVLARKVLYQLQSKKMMLLSSTDAEYTPLESDEVGSRLTEKKNSQGNTRRSDVEGTSSIDSTYESRNLCGFISTSAPYNLVAMRRVFHQLGFSDNIQKSIFSGTEKVSNDNVFEQWSTYHLMKKCQEEFTALNSLTSNSEKLFLKDYFPNICVIHGSIDKTVPVEESYEFVSLLSNLRIPHLFKLYKGWTHTDPILEAPMRGDHLYHRDVYNLVYLWTSRAKGFDSEVDTCDDCNPSNQNGFNESIPYPKTDGEPDAISLPGKVRQTFDENHPMLRPICPELLVRIARRCNPF